MLLLTGVLSGIVSGLGMGGGTILIIILTSFLHYEQHVAQANNLVFFIPTSIAALYVHAKNHNINKKIVIKMIPLCIVGALIGSYLSGIIETERLRKFFAIFLLCVGVYEIFITVKNNKR